VLRARGYDLHYVEFNGVHSELNWQDWLADGLVHVFGRRTR
jgi:enterochelin esterase-like enzyme